MSRTWLIVIVITFCAAIMLFLLALWLLQRPVF
jgi:hypothetical protein